MTSERTTLWRQVNQWRRQLLRCFFAPSIQKKIAMAQESSILAGLVTYKIRLRIEAFGKSWFCVLASTETASFLCSRMHWNYNFPMSLHPRKLKFSYVLAPTETAIFICPRIHWNCNFHMSSHPLKRQFANVLASTETAICKCLRIHWNGNFQRADRALGCVF